MSDQYILDGKNPVPAPSLAEWGRWFEDRDRTVARSFPMEGVHVSTVFLGIDHAWGGGKPLLFETMIFGGKHADYQARYSTWDEAEAGHARAVQMVKEG